MALIPTRQERLCFSNLSKPTYMGGIMMSLNMLIENGDGFDYTHGDFEGWAKAAGFRRVEALQLAGPTSAAIAYK
jgi:hypothetical protein